MMRGIDAVSLFAFYNYVGYGLGQDVSSAW
jgi:hypothetical protein